MIKNEFDKCPRCGGDLQPRGCVIRKVKNSRGDIFQYRLPRFSCKVCKSWHRIVPDYILPYKQYFKSVVESSPEELAYENVSDSTIKRWSQK